METLVSLAGDIDGELAQACSEIENFKVCEERLKASLGTHYELLFKALSEVSGTVRSIGSIPEQLKGDVLESARQTVDYNVNKFLIKDSAKKEVVLKWLQELKYQLKPSAAPSYGASLQLMSQKAAFVLEDSSRWTLKGYKKGASEELLQPSEINLNQSMNIYDSQGAIVKVSKKCKSALVESCSELGLIVNSVISGIELVNSRKCQVQFEGNIPSITIDSCDEITLFISEESLKTVQIYTCKVSQVIIKVLSPEGDLLRELPIPEQFKSSFVSGKLETLPLAHAGV